MTKEKEGPGVTSAFIQWKGTDVCCDVRCGDCGNHYHIDGEFFYGWTCECGAHWKSPHHVTFERVSEPPGNLPAFYLMPRDAV